MPKLVSNPDLESYPSSDGQPMGETWLHVRAIMLLHQAMEDFFQNRTDVFIASDMFWYWKKGDRKACIAPDVMVVLGLEEPDPESRRSYFSWKEGGKVPSVVFEMASETTWEDDLDEKLTTYAERGVPEYFLFDPEAIYLKPPLQGFRLRGDTYRPIPASAMESRLGFRLKAEGRLLRVVDSKTGKPILTRAEAVEQEKANVDLLAAEVERLKKQLGRSGP